MRSSIVLMVVSSRPQQMPMKNQMAICKAEHESVARLADTLHGLTRVLNADNMGCTAKQMVKIKNVIAIMA